MTYFKIFILFFATLSFSQKALLQLKIDSITFTDSIPNERKFTINYHLQNVTNQTLRFFMDGFFTNKNGSNKTSHHYQLFQNKLFLNVNSILKPTIIKEELSKKEYMLKLIADKDKLKESLKKIDLENGINSDSMRISFMQGDKIGSYNWKRNNKQVLESITSLNPNEQIKFTRTMYWNKIKYYKQDENEYFLDENANYFIEFFVNLRKEEFKESLTQKQYDEILNDKNFIKGVFFTEKTKINLNN